MALSERSQRPRSSAFLKQLPKLSSRLPSAHNQDATCLRASLGVGDIVAASFSSQHWVPSAAPGASATLAAANSIAVCIATQAESARRAQLLGATSGSGNRERSWTMRPRCRTGESGGTAAGCASDGPAFTHAWSSPRRGPGMGKPIGGLPGLPPTWGFHEHRPCLLMVSHLISAPDLFLL